MRTRSLNTWPLLALLILLVSACASSGGGGGGGAADMAAAPPAAPDYKNETGDNGLPTVRALLARYVEAIGGEDAIRSRSSSTSMGKFSLEAMGIEGDFTIYSKAPNMMKLVISTAMGDIQQGFDGENAWSDDPMSGAQVLEGATAAASRAQATFHLPLAYDDLYTTQETLEEAEFEGEAAYKVKLVDAADGETMQYFSKDSSLILGQEAVQDGPMGSAEIKVVLSDYKDFGGVLTATKTVTHTSGIEIVNTIETITFDDVDDASLEPPDSIKSQL